MREITKQYWLILQTHNPTLQMSYLSMDIKVRRALEISFISILVSNFSPTLIYDTYLFKAGTIWINLCYSVLASIIFFYFNEHLQKFTKRTRAYVFETKKLNALLREIIGYMQTVQVSEEDIQSTSINKINLYDYSTDPPLEDEVINPEASLITFANWKAYSVNKRNKIIEVVEDLLSYHESLDPALVECLREILEECKAIDIISNDTLAVRGITYRLLALHDQLAVLRPIITRVYQYIKPVSDFRLMIRNESNNNSYPGEYRMDLHWQRKEMNRIFVRNLAIFCVLLGIIISLLYFE